jgi:hypothetical protein
MTRKREHFLQGIFGANFPVYTGSGYMPSSYFGIGSGSSSETDDDSTENEDMGAEAGSSLG